MCNGLVSVRLSVPSIDSGCFAAEDRLHGFPRLFTDTSERNRFLLFFSIFFCFPRFSFVVPCGILS